MDPSTYVADREHILAYGNSLAVGTAYLIGLAHARTGAPLETIIPFANKLESEEASGKITTADRLQIEQELVNGDFSAAQALLQVVEMQDSLPSLQKSMSLSDKLKLELIRTVSFSERVEIRGSTFAKNEFTGELIDVSAAEMYKKAIAGALQKIEKVPGTPDLAMSRSVSSKSVEDQEPIRCEICYNDIPVDEWIPLETCGHIFHTDCFRDYCEFEIMNTKFPLQCPKCRTDLLVSDIQDRLSATLLERYEEFSFKAYVMSNMSDLACCPTPNCPYVFIWDADGRHFACPVCEKGYCFACRGDWHPEFTCEEFQKINNTEYQDQAFESLASSKRFKQCPQCRFWVEKSEGCDHMTCRCSFEFCYVCGGTYQACACTEANQ